MPTGYTSDIENDQSFEDFVYWCATAFGAMINFRDDPAKAVEFLKSDKELPSSVSDYYVKEVEQAKADVAVLESKDLEAEYKEYVEITTTNHKNRLAKCAALEDKYKKMLAKVNAWYPPSPEHRGLKNFMVEQIESSIKFDCYYKTEQLSLLPFKVWKANVFELAKSRLQSARESLADEHRRINARNKWVNELRKSLKCTTSTTTS